MSGIFLEVTRLLLMAVEVVSLNLCVCVVTVCVCVTDRECVWESSGSMAALGSAMLSSPRSLTSGDQPGM